MWQDAAILCLNLAFGVLLIPQILDLHKKGTSMNISSGTATLAALGILWAIYATLGLWLAVCGDGIDIAAWGLLVGISIKNAT
jgi:hypothetical protein